VLEFPEDPTTRGVGDQWLVGDALLVAPILNETGHRRVYLPEGGWTDWWSGERSEGPRWIEVEADLATLPLWLRDGAVIPLGPVMDHVDQKPLDALALRIAPFREQGSRTLRIPTADAEIGIRYAYEGGRHRVDAPPGLEITLDVVGPQAPAVDLR
jgi:alpha-glucosidase (family GH31 glycosyl hydrolase)